MVRIYQKSKLNLTP